MVEPLSPLGAAWTPGRFVKGIGRPGVTLSEVQPGSIVQVAAWPGEDAAALEAVRAVTGLGLEQKPGAGAFTETASAFGIGPGRFLVVAEAEGLEARLKETLPEAAGTVLDLSHGRTILRVEGADAERVMSKLFALDFRASAYPLGEGRSTMHHQIFAQIQRTADFRFDLVTFRSFARSFWTTLRHAAEEYGYEVA